MTTNANEQQVAESAEDQAQPSSGGDVEVKPKATTDGNPEPYKTDGNPEPYDTPN